MSHFFCISILFPIWFLGQLNHVPRPPIVIKKSKVDDDYTIYEELGRWEFFLYIRIEMLYLYMNNSFN